MDTNININIDELVDKLEKNKKKLTSLLSTYKSLLLIENKLNSKLTCRRKSLRHIQENHSKISGLFLQIKNNLC